MVTPKMVQILAGVARNFITNIHVGRQFTMTGAVPRLGAEVPRWYGETIGFWDDDVPPARASSTTRICQRTTGSGGPSTLIRRFRD